MRAKLVLILLSFFLLPLSVSAQLVTLEGIKVEGEVTADPALILSTFGLRIGDRVSPDEIREGIKRLYGLGLFSDVRVEAKEGSLGVELTLRLKEYPILERVEFSGNRKMDSAKLKEAVSLVEGGLIRPGEVKEDAEKIRSLYRKEGYYLAKVEHEKVPSEEERKTVLRFNITEGKKVRVKRIEVEGNDFLDDGKIKGQMETKEKRWWRGGGFDEEKFQKDREKIVELYREEGYIEARVLSDSIWFDPSKEGMFIKLWVEEGPRYLFGEVSWEGAKLFPEEELRRQLKFAPNQVFNQKRYEESLAGLYFLYQEKGYIYAQIQDQTRKRGHKLDILYKIEEGEPAEVQRIIIGGNTKTWEKVIRRELAIKPGEIFSRSALMRSLRNVTYLNFFEEVTPDFQTLPDGNIDLILRVKEKFSGQVSAGFGYSETDKLVGTASFSIPNFLGRGERLDLSSDFGKRTKNFNFGYTIPWFRDTPTTVGLDLYQNTRRWTGYYTEERRGGAVRFGRRLRFPDNYFRLYLKYRIESIRFYDFSEIYRDLNPEYDLSLESWPKVTSATTFTLERDSRDMPQFATRGTYHSLSSELAGGVFGGDVDYHKEIFETQWYFPTFWGFVLSLRGRIGVVDGYRSPSTVPFSERFFPGGTSFDGMIRGYDDRSIGPRLDGLEIGGRSVLVYNLEYRFPLAEQQVYLLLFADAGNSWLSGRAISPFNLYQSVGVGVRFVIPMLGVMGFDFGYGLDKNFGGWHPHFQLGRAF